MTRQGDPCLPLLALALALVLWKSSASAHSLLLDQTWHSEPTTPPPAPPHLPPQGPGEASPTPAGPEGLQATQGTALSLSSIQLSTVESPPLPVPPAVMTVKGQQSALAPQPPPALTALSPFPAPKRPPQGKTPASKQPPPPAPCPKIPKPVNNSCSQHCPDFPGNATSGKCQGKCSGGCCSYAWSANVPYITGTNKRKCNKTAYITQFGTCSVGTCDVDETISSLPVDACLSVCGTLSDGTVLAQSSEDQGGSGVKAAADMGFEGACISGPCEGNVSYTFYVVQRIQPQAGNLGAGVVVARPPSKVLAGMCTVNDCVPRGSPKRETRWPWVTLTLTILSAVLVGGCI